jgi:hypothetical protein
MPRMLKIREAATEALISVRTCQSHQDIRRLSIIGALLEDNGFNDIKNPPEQTSRGVILNTPLSV